MKLGNSGKCPDDVPDDICHPPAKSRPKSHSRVIRRSSACHPQVICTSSARRPHEISTGNIFPLKEQTALLKTKTEDEEPEVLFCLHCRSETHRIEDCAAYKVAQAKRKKVWCEKCKQYGHTIADCLDEKQEQRNKEIEREILKRKQQLEEIDRKMQPSQETSRKRYRETTTR